VGSLRPTRHFGILATAATGYLLLAIQVILNSPQHIDAARGSHLKVLPRRGATHTLGHGVTSVADATRGLAGDQVLAILQADPAHFAGRHNCLRSVTGDGATLGAEVTSGWPGPLRTTLQTLLIANLRPGKIIRSLMGC
jgi:hypothetical protein